jgi:hypothetical protein
MTKKSAAALEEGRRLRGMQDKEIFITRNY